MKNIYWSRWCGFLAGLVVMGSVFVFTAAKEYTESFSVDKAKCTRIMLIVSDTEIKGDCYWNLCNSQGTVIKENVKTSCDPTTQTNNVTFNDIKTYVSGPLKDHYKAQKQNFSGVDE